MSTARETLEGLQGQEKEVLASRLEDVLNEAPDRLAYLSSIVNGKKENLDEAEHALRIAKAQATLDFQAGSKNILVLQSRVEVDERVIAATKAVREAKAEVLAAEALHRHAYDEFISARKIGGMQKDEWHAIRGQRVNAEPIRDDDGNLIDPITGEILESSPRKNARV